MLVTFSCKAYADITLFGDVALQLLRMMGRRAAVPGAMTADEVGLALDKLEQALSGASHHASAEAPAATDIESEPAVSLRHRALPLMDLLKHAQNKQCNVMWK